MFEESFRYSLNIWLDWREHVVIKKQGDRL